MNHTIKIKKRTETALVIPDVHSPYEHKPAIEVAKQIAKDIRPDHLVFLGDCFDAEYLGRWTKATVEEGIYKTLEEIDHFKKHVFEPLTKAAKKADVYWLGGNHDMQRIKDVIEELPDRKKQLDLQAMFPGVRMCEYNEYIKIGKLHFTHGTYTNSHHSKKTAESYMVNIMYGHTHDYQTYTKHTPLDQQAITAMSVGSVCSMNPKYMKNRPHNWIHMIAVVYFQKNGNFTAYPIPIIDDKTIFNGKLYG